MPVLHALVPCNKWGNMKAKFHTLGHYACLKNIKDQAVAAASAGVIARLVISTRVEEVKVWCGPI